MGVSGLAGLALLARAKRFRHRSASLRQAGQLSSFLFRAYSRNFFPWQRECDATYYPISSCIKKRRQRFMQIMHACSALELYDPVAERLLLVREGAGVSRAVG